MPKRKHSDKADSSKPAKKSLVKITVKDTPGSVESPYLAAFPGTQPPTTTPFQSYRSALDDNDEKRLVKGETEKVVFTGANFGEDAPESFSNYLVGVYSKSKNSVTFVPAPVLRVRRTVKALESVDDAIRNRSTAFKEAKTSLGLAFGTAKAKKQLKDTERNAVQGSHIEDTLHDMHREIGQSTGPSKDELKKAMKEDLPIPAHNMDAEKPSDVYDLSSIVTEEELVTMPVKEVLQAKPKTPKELGPLMPFSHSKFINHRVLQTIQASGKVDRPRLRVLMYISCLMAYYCRVNAKNVKDRRKVETALRNPSSLVLDNLIERYTTNEVRTPFDTDKILCYLLVLCLSVADYQVDPDILASDLSLKSAKVATVLRNLGCKVENGKPKPNGVVTKKASLVVPLKFPEVTRGRRK